MAASTDNLTLPVVALHDAVIFPGMVLPLRIGRALSVRAVETAQAQGGKVLLVAEREPVQDIDPEKLFRVGTVAQIGQLLRLQDGTYQALMQGLVRARIDEWILGEGLLSARTETVDERCEKTIEVEALMRTVVDQIERYGQLSSHVPEGAAEAARQIAVPGRLADAVAYSP